MAEMFQLRCRASIDRFGASFFVSSYSSVCLLLKQNVVIVNNSQPLPSKAKFNAMVMGHYQRMDRVHVILTATLESIDRGTNVNVSR